MTIWVVASFVCSELCCYECVYVYLFEYQFYFCTCFSNDVNIFVAQGGGSSGGQWAEGRGITRMLVYALRWLLRGVQTGKGQGQDLTQFTCALCWLLREQTVRVKVGAQDQGRGD